MIKVAIVGFGSAGKHYYKLLKNKKVELFVIDNVVIAKNNDFKIITLDTIKEEKLFFDFAIICSPSGLHYQHADFFLKRFSNVLIEKPFVLKLEHAKKLIQLSKKKKVKCWTALQNRYNLAISSLGKELKNKSIGKVFMADCTMIWHRNRDYYKAKWRGNYKTDGGVLTNQGIHLLDALIYNFGEISNFNVIADFNKKKLQAEDLIVINLKHKNGVISNFKATTRANQDYISAIDVIGTKGRIIVKGISLNAFYKFVNKDLVYFKKNSEEFKLGMGPISGMGFGHKKLLDEFLKKKLKSSKDLEIDKNYYLLKLIHSIYNVVFTKIKKNKVKNKNSLLGI
jgi:UDP-N-acetyl-2-amino-2-deoxyglucuronate dehydrogenase